MVFNYNMIKMYIFVKKSIFSNIFVSIIIMYFYVLKVIMTILHSNVKNVCVKLKTLY